MSDFWYFRGFVRWDKCRLDIFEAYITKIYIESYIGKFWELVRIRKIVWVLVNKFLFEFLPQGSAIWLNVPKKSVFLTPRWKAFSVEMQETSVSKCNKPKKWWTSNRSDFLNFRLIGFKSTKKCAKLTILNMKWGLQNSSATK